MKKYVFYILILLTVLTVSCVEDHPLRTFVYAVENELNDPVTLVFYVDSLDRTEVATFVVQPKDSIVIYDCFISSGQGVCTPFDHASNDRIADFGSFIFEDGKQLDFSKPIQFSNPVAPYNLFAADYDENTRPEADLLISSFRIDTTEYLLAE